MTPSDAPVSAARSPRRARLLLVAACAAGLSGLALLGGGTSPLLEATTPVANVTPVFVQAPVAVPPRVISLHATRTRVLPAKKKAPVLSPSASARLRWVRPSSAGIVSPYGPRWGRMHKGIDFGAGYGAPIRAAGDGVVIGAGYLSEESGYGKITVIRHANGFYSAYAHQSRMLVHAGSRVRAGELIGYVGSTGHSTGPHLHFEVRRAPHGGQVNPVPWLRKHGIRV